MIGCAFAIDREFFYKSGSYDKEMLIWGGENVEMSVRVWRCGGLLMVSPCSHIGHVYRSVTPHSIPGSLQEKRDRPTINTARFAEVWLDNYKDFYYNINPDAQGVNIGDIKDRKSLIEELKCFSFQWFIDNVYPDAPFPNHHKYFGQVRHEDSNLCIDALGTNGGSSGMKVCHGLGAMQMILYTMDMELRNGINCIEPLFNNKTGRLEAVFLPCNFQPEQQWKFEKSNDGENERGTLINVGNRKCLTFNSAEEQSGGTKYKRKNNMLSFLAKVVKESVEEVQTPYIYNCENSGNSHIFQSQIWRLDFSNGNMQ